VLATSFILYWLLESSALIQIGRLGCQTKFLPKIPKKLADEVSSQHSKTTLIEKPKPTKPFIKAK